MTRLARAWLLAATVFVAPAVTQAISGTEQVRLAGEGRFDELAERLVTENEGPAMSTADRHGLCFAYSKLKDYSRLNACLDELQRGAARGDRRTRLFGLDDVAPAIDLMRAEAAIDVADYPSALDAARRALGWYAQQRSSDRDVEIGALGFIVVASVLAGDLDGANRAYTKLQAVDVSWPRYNSYANAKALAAARAGIALQQWPQVLAALAGNKTFEFQVFMDNLLSGAASRGRSNWVWQELPRAYMVARATLEVGRRDEARSGYERLLKVPEIVSNGEIHWLALYDRGRIAEDDGQEVQAVEHYRRAVDAIERQRASINTEASKIGFVGRRHDVYVRLIRLLLKRPDAEAAFEYVERSKSRALVDLLASRLNTPAALHAGPEEATAVATFFRLESESRRQVPVAAAGSGSGDRRAEFQGAGERLRQAAPQIASLVSVDRMSVAEIQRQIEPDEALLQYYIGGDEGSVFVVTRAAVRVVAFSAAGLDEEVRQLRVAIEQRSRSVNEATGRLYRRLMSEALKDLQQPKLLIVPHGPLHYLSFAALHDGDAYLIDRFTLRTLPIATVLRYLRTRSSNAGREMLLLGNPDLGQAQYDLPNAQVEVEMLAKGSAGSRLLVRKAASETAFIADAGKFRFVHIASHGVFNDKQPLDSALLLSPDERNDGNLTAAELYGLRLDAELVTLSACETGVGQSLSGDEIVGLTRGFLYAGASSIVASLWNVDDRATSLLMQRFYAELARGDKRQAMRTAQLETRKRFPHPFFWAAFFLVGNP